MKQLVSLSLFLFWSSTSWAVYLKMPDVEPMVNPNSSASHAGTRLLKFYKVPMDEKKFRRNCPAFVKGENIDYGNSPDLLKKCLNLNSGRGMSFETTVVGSVESLQSMLDRNTPIIILTYGLGLTSGKNDESPPEYEYLIVSGYNKKTQSFHVMAGDNESKKISFQKLFKSWNFDRSTHSYQDGYKRRTYSAVGGSMIFLQSQTHYSNNQNQARSQSSQTSASRQADSPQKFEKSFKIPPGNMTRVTNQNFQRNSNCEAQFPGGNAAHIMRMNCPIDRDKVPPPIRGGAWPTVKSIKDEMPPVKAQGPRGTCSAFAAVALAEFITKKELSEQCLVSASSGKDPGTIDQRAAWIMTNGIHRNSDCPYEGYEGGQTKIPHTVPSKKKQWPHASLERFGGNDYESRLNYIREKISSGVPVGISVFLVGDWWQDKIVKINDVVQEKVLVAELPSKDEEDEWKEKKCVTGSDGNLSCTGHALVVSGYNDATRLLQIRNSWGPNWKAGGYAEIPYDYLYYYSTINAFVSLTPLPGTSDEKFIEDSYQQLFNREAEPGGFNYWIHRLRNEGLSRGYILALLYEENETFLNQVYWTYLGRPFDDHEGWAPKVLATSGRAQVLSDICGTQEHINFCAPNFLPSVQCHEDFVNRCYQQILNREAEPEHRSAWTWQVAMRFGRFETRKRIADAPESLVQKLYLTFMGRWASRGEAEYWMKEINPRGFDGVRNAIKNSEEARNLNTPLRYWD